MSVILDRELGGKRVTNAVASRCQKVGAQAGKQRPREKDGGHAEVAGARETEGDAGDTVEPGEGRGKMGRRRTLINGFGADQASGRVSVKKKCASGLYDDGNSNCRSAERRYRLGRRLVSHRICVHLGEPLCVLFFLSIPLLSALACHFFFHLVFCIHRESGSRGASQRSRKKRLVGRRVNDVTAVESNFASVGAKKRGRSGPEFLFTSPREFVKPALEDHDNRRRTASSGGPRTNVPVEFHFAFIVSPHLTRFIWQTSAFALLF